MNNIIETMYLDIPKHPGWRCRVDVRQDDLGPPWEENECHGPVREARVSRYDLDHRHATGKRAGEVVLHDDNGTFWYYDFAEAMKQAKRDGWGLSAEEGREEMRRLYYRGLSAGQRAASTTAEINARADGMVLTPGQARRAAVAADMKYLRGWLRGDWCWVWIDVMLVDEDGSPISGETDTLGGLESDDPIHPTALSLAYALVEAEQARIDALARGAAAVAEVEQGKRERLIAALLSAWLTIDHARFAVDPERVMTECDWTTVQRHLAAELHAIDGRVMPDRFYGQVSRETGEQT